MVKVYIEHDYPSRSSAEVFSALSDHVKFFAKARLDCRMLESGKDDPNGLGAVREIRAGRVRFIEDITAFQASISYEYRIRKLYVLGLPLPFQHDLGHIEVMSTTQGSRVIWQSHFHCTLPLAGSYISRKMQPDVERTFSKLLRKLFD